MKVEFTVDDKWQATYALDQADLDVIYKLADLFQAREAEGLDIDDIVHMIEHKHEKEDL